MPSRLSWTGCRTNTDHLRRAVVVSDPKKISGKALKQLWLVSLLAGALGFACALRCIASPGGPGARLDIGNRRRWRRSSPMQFSVLLVVFDLRTSAVKLCRGRYRSPR